MPSKTLIQLRGVEELPFPSVPDGEITSSLYRAAGSWRDSFMNSRNMIPRSAVKQATGEHRVPSAKIKGEVFFRGVALYRESVQTHAPPCRVMGEADKANAEFDANFIPSPRGFGFASASLKDSDMVTCTRGSSSIYVADKLRPMPGLWHAKTRESSNAHRKRLRSILGFVRNVAAYH